MRVAVATAFLLLAVLASAACGEEEAGPTPSAVATVTGTQPVVPTRLPPVQGISVYASVSKATYQPGESVRVMLIVENVSQETKRLSFRSGQRYDFVIEDSEGREVWRWSDGEVFTQVLAEQNVAPGQMLVYTEEWDQRDKAGSQVPEGAYTVRGLLVGCLAGTDICDLAGTATFRIGGQP